MTRRAKGEPSNRKQPHEPTEWMQLKEAHKPTKKGLSSKRKCHTDSLQTSSKRKNTGAERTCTKQKTDTQSVENKTRPSSSFRGQDISSAASGPGQQISPKEERKISVATFLQRVQTFQHDSERSSTTGSALITVSETNPKEKRREDRRLRRVKKRLNDQVCYKCREPGHTMESCPSLDQDEGTGICFKCGSTEHIAAKCKLKLPPGVHPYSKCFICGEQGHISKQCPDNPRGLYPNGGCCKNCGSVEHYKKDCPAAHSQGAETRLEIVHGLGSADAQRDLDQPPNVADTARAKQPKVVKF